MDATLHRLEVAVRSDHPDMLGRKVRKRIGDFLGIGLDDVRLVKVYTVAGVDEPGVRKLLAEAALHDPVLHVASLTPLAQDFDWLVEVGFRPGVTDNEGRTAEETLALVLGEELDKGHTHGPAVYTSTQYLLSGGVDKAAVEHIGRDLLANELIQRMEIKSRKEWEAGERMEARTAKVSGQAVDEVLPIDLSAMTDEELVAFSRENVLALSLEEMRRIRDYFERTDIREKRAAAGYPAQSTDAEVEMLAQTWSEHCQHKIFNARISYQDRERGISSVVDSLYKSCIQKPTAFLRHRMGSEDFCLSVFKDNAGVLRFTEDHSLCIKVETHNSPSALDPYGGALTGIVGVNRDPMGTGLGANMVCNTDVFCFASPFHDEELPPRLLHPRRVLEGVREGVEHGGNKSGIPTVNGSIVFHERFLGKPLVYCGTVGMMPAVVAGRPSHEKKAEPGDYVVMTGGRIGKDGIHGATFSSEELHEGSPATAVQIGDPITQRRMYDFLMRVRDMGLYNAITDNGAGGLSSSVGEMAEDTDGCEIDLAKAPLKYDGLRPWEILLSEAQERMTLAVPPENLDEFLALAVEMEVEAVVLGRFTDDGWFRAVHNGRPAVLLDMEFLHNGAPRLELEAVWERPIVAETPIPPIPETEQASLLKRMLGRLNVCSKEYVVRQYDHEVKGGSVIKPLVGVEADGPGDAAVMRPLLDREEGLVLGHGICPKFSDLDTYWMMANALDEAVRNAVAVGADPGRLAGVDNFCWCDPIQSEKTPDGRYKLAQLVRANQALAHFCLAYGVPCVSGKDSMKNDYSVGGVKISIPPTVLFTVLGVIQDASKTATSDFKSSGDQVFLLGLTRRELGGSELADELSFSSDSVPQVEAVSARKRYQALHQAITSGLVTACHDLSDGGLGCALAEMGIGGRLGVRVDLDRVPKTGQLTATEILYSETPSRLLVTVRPGDVAAFEALFAGQTLACIGEVVGMVAGEVAGKVAGEAEMIVSQDKQTILQVSVEELARAWKATLEW